MKHKHRVKLGLLPCEHVGDIRRLYSHWCCGLTGVRANWCQRSKYFRLKSDSDRLNICVTTATTANSHRHQSARSPEKPEHRVKSLHRQRDGSEHGGVHKDTEVTSEHPIRCHCLKNRPIRGKITDSQSALSILTKYNIVYDVMLEQEVMLRVHGDQDQQNIELSGRKWRQEEAGTRTSAWDQEKNCEPVTELS